MTTSRVRLLAGEESAKSQAPKMHRIVPRTHDENVVWITDLGTCSTHSKIPRYIPHHHAIVSSPNEATIISSSSSDGNIDDLQVFPTRHSDLPGGQRRIRNPSRPQRVQSS